MPAGTQTITFSYPGDNNYAADPDTGTVGIVQAVPVVNFTSSSNPIAANTPLTFAITLTSPTSGTPTGTVTFKDGGVTLTNGVVTLVNGVASLTTSSLSSGTHSITAIYSTDTNFALPAAVPTISQVISTGNTSILLTASTTTPAIGTTVTYSATVTAPANSLVPATGSINVFDSTSGTPLCAISAIQLAAGVVTNGNVITQTCTYTYNGTSPAISASTM